MLEHFFRKNIPNFRFLLLFSLISSIIAGSGSAVEISHLDKGKIRHIALPSNADTSSCRWSLDSQKVILETCLEYQECKNPYNLFIKPQIISKYPKTIVVDISTGKISDFHYLGKALFKPYFSPKGNSLAFLDASGNMVVQKNHKTDGSQKIIIRKKVVFEKVKRERNLENIQSLNFEQVCWSFNERFLALWLQISNNGLISEGVLALFDLELKKLTILDPYFTSSLSSFCAWNDKDYGRLYFIKNRKVILSLNTLDSLTQTLYKSQHDTIEDLRYNSNNLLFIKGEQSSGDRCLYKMVANKSIQKVMNNVQCYDIRAKDGLAIIKGINYDLNRYYGFFENIYSYNFKTDNLELLNFPKERTGRAWVGHIKWAPDSSKFLVCGYDSSDYDYRVSHRSKPIMIVESLPYINDP